MPVFNTEVTGGLPDFAAMIRTFPGLSARVLAYLGKEAAMELAAMMERGEKGITFRDMDSNRKSRGSRRMITYSIGKGAKYVRISSFPLNLFEGGRKLRSGKREGARNIIRGSLKSAMSGKLQGSIEAAANVIIDDWYNKEAKGAMKTL